MQKYNTSRNAQQVMAEFIDNMDWDYFATLTTSYEQTMKSARRSVERFHDRANQNSATTIFFASEPYDVKDGFHVHALIKTEMEFQNLVECYQITSGGQKLGIKQRIQLRKFYKGEGGAMYCAKYITKRLSDWDILLPKNTLFT